MIVLPGDPSGRNDHASEVNGCPHAWPLLPRIFLASARRRRSLLPGLLALRRRVQVRLENDEAHQARSERARSERRDTTVQERKEAHLGSARAPFVFADRGP